MIRRIAALMLLLGGFTLLSACSKNNVRCTSPEDNPQHHYLMGMKALEDGNGASAQEKFERAVFCNDEYSPGYAGLAIAIADKAGRQADENYRKLDAEQIFKYLRKARKHVDGDEELFDYYAGVIRSQTLLKDSNWLYEAEDAYKDGKRLKVDERNLVYYQGKEALTCFIGIAYLEAFEFAKARDSFAEVLNAKREGKWHEKADRGWKKADKIVRAMAGLTVGDVGKKIAVMNSVSRGDLAALLIDEIKIDRLLAGRIPVASQVSALKAEFTPADIANHPFKQEILTIMKWKVRGLEPKYVEASKAYLFKPYDSVSRGEMAFILEDILIKLTGDEKLATAYFGQDKSPFPDVRPTSPVYNAVMNITTRSIMESELSGEFRVNDPVDGAEVMLAIRMLKQKMNIY